MLFFLKHELALRSIKSNIEDELDNLKLACYSQNKILLIYFETLNFEEPEQYDIWKICKEVFTPVMFDQCKIFKKETP